MSTYRAYEQRLDSGLAQVCLTSDSCQLALLPACGFKMVSAVYAGRQLLMPTQDLGAPGASSGVPILFPMPNRTKDCRYTYGGHSCEIRKNGELRYLHGLLVDEPFSYTFGADENGAWCTGSASITPDKEYFSSYPFPCTLQLTYTLSGAGVRLDYTVTNDGEETLPFGFAIHPYFDKMGEPEQVTLCVPAGSYYEAEQQLPTGKLLPAQGAFDLCAPRPVAQLRLDHVYHGLSSSKEAVVSYQRLGLSLSLRASDEFVNMVVYTPQNRPGFCLENQTCATDFLNLHARGVETSHMLELPAGQSFSGWILCAVSAG